MQSTELLFLKYIAYLNNSKIALKRHNPGKIIKKSVFSYIVHRPELRKFFFNFCVAHLPVKRDIN